MSNNNNNTKKRKSKKSAIDDDVMEAFSMYAEENNLDCDGLQQALAALGISTTKKAAKAFFPKGKKSLDVDEFAAVYEECNSKRSITDELEQAFDMFDEESRGFITHADLQRVAKELGEKFSEDDLIEMIRVAENEDGLVTKETFVKFMSQLLK